MGRRSRRGVERRRGTVERNGEWGDIIERRERGNKINRGRGSRFPFTPPQPSTPNPRVSPLSLPSFPPPIIPSRLIYPSHIPLSPSHPHFIHFLHVLELDMADVSSGAGRGRRERVEEKGGEKREMGKGGGK